MKKLSLQWRVTVLTALVLMVCTIVLTTISIKNAEQSFIDLYDAITPALPLTPSTGVDDAILPAVPTQVAKKQFDTTSIL